MSAQLRLTPGLLLITAATLLVPISRAGAEANVPSKPQGRPALELKKVISFPLDGNSIPSTQQGLADAITAALSKRLELPQGARPVRTAGDAYPKLDALTVDFTDSAINSGRQVPKLYPHGKAEQVIRAKQFQIIADPMKIDGAAMHLRISAEDVDLAFQRDQTNHPLLVVTAARTGQMEFHTTQADLSRMFRASAHFRGQRYGLSVQRADLKLTSDNEHQIKADLKLRSALVLLPIQLHFTAKVDVKDDGEAHVSNLTCDGDDAAGWLISGFIKPALKKYNGQTMPLVQFPSDQIKLHNVQVKLDGDAVRVAAVFGNEKAPH